MELKYLKLSQLSCDENQIRRKGHCQADKDDDLESLAYSIKEVGLVNPLVVKALGEDRYQVVAGERRFLAAQRAELESIPCFVLDKSEEALDYQLAENFHRKDLDPLAKAYVVQLLKKRHVEDQKVAKLLGVSSATITQWTKILGVPPKYQQAIVDNFNDKSKSPLTVGHLAVVAVKGITKEQVNEILDLVIEHQLSRDKTEQLVKLLKSDPALNPQEAFKKLLSMQLDAMGGENEKQSREGDYRKRFVLVVPPNLPPEPEKQEELRLKFSEHLNRLDNEIQRLFNTSLNRFIRGE
ncbi:MAG: ParB/RepB/Spo0J family partition protein [Firmicutes bacterium]|nr:ParB/RepB/Spo0J family partition protein [Bacillota bacterium]